MDKKNNPVWNYSDLIRRIKRWSFTSKMAWASEASKKLMTPEARDPAKLRLMALPSEIETFTMLAIKNGELQSKEMAGQDFSQAIMAIRAFRHPKLFGKKDGEFGNWISMLISATQFDFQANPIYRINRYLSYFNYADEHIDMNAEVKRKFQLSYQEIAAPIIFLYFVYSQEIDLSDKQFMWFLARYKKTIDLLTLNRTDYINELNSFTSEMEDYIYCIRPSYSWPFVSDEGFYYLPTPHLLIRSVTVSLMHRLTFEDDSLRERIGKYVLEPYLYKLICRNDEFQEVLSEQEYGNGQRTLDVMASIGNNIICFDSKSFTPSVGIRTFDSEAYDRTIKRLVKSVVQAYKHIRYKFGNEYSFLSVPLTEDRSNIYAIVVLADNPYCPLEEIYSLAASQLKICIPSNEYDWLRGHVGIADLDVIEVQILQGENFMEAVTGNIQTEQFSDHWFLQAKTNPDNERDEYMDNPVSDFVSTIIDDMKKDGML